MCFSAQVWADYRKYLKKYNAKISIRGFIDLLERRGAGERINLPKGLTDAFKFDTSSSADAELCRRLVHEFEEAENTRIETELFTQRRRLADAERKLAAKPTKTAANEQRIANNLIARALTRLDDLRRSEPKPRDSRVYSGWYCPVLVQGADGELVVRPMRYQCRPPDMPADCDKRYPGCYNARRDNLQGCWKRVYGQSHAMWWSTPSLSMLTVTKQKVAIWRRESSRRMSSFSFAPGDGQVMQLATLWSHWKGEEAGLQSELLSFAIVTDEPPPEVAAAGHDRCPIPLKPQNVSAWLATPASTDYQALLDDRERPYYQHRLAAAA